MATKMPFVGRRLRDQPVWTAAIGCTSRPVLVATAAQPEQRFAGLINLSPPRNEVENTDESIGTSARRRFINDDVHAIRR